MSLRRRAAVAHRRFLELRARDVTAAVSTHPAVVFAPHPDDETIGCGATIARKAAAGTRVHVVVAADGGDAIRRDECRAACARLGLDEANVEFLGLPDGGLAAHRDELGERVRASVTALAPRELYVPANVDQHPDHRALAAVVPAPGVAALAGVTVYEYPVWFWNRWAWVDGGSPARQAAQFARRFATHLVGVRPRTVRTGDFLAAKRSAVVCYRSQLATGPRRDGLDPGWIEQFLGAHELFFERR